MRTFKITFSLLLLLAIFVRAQQKNILFIAVDDLKPNIKSFGDTVAVTPNIDRLAEAGTIFTNNQCQQAVCGPSRASLLTGWRPDKTQVWDLQTLIRDRNPDVVTLPQYFRENGYVTYGTGKIFDPRSVDSQHDAQSWDTYVKINGSRWIVSSEHVATECVDTAESVYVDGKIAAQGLQFLEQAATSSQPFFIAVGFKKPHLPFVAPAHYWDYYGRDTIPLAPFQQHAANTPDFIYNIGSELRNNYVDIPETGDLPDTLQKRLVHGYYACVSFIDAQIGKLINKLDTLGLSDNTIIVLWGDHGWHLGDHAQWTKHTNFEQATRAPMIFVVPDYAGGRVISTPTEFLDIYPTLCDLAGLEIPEGLAGASLKPVLENQTERAHPYAISQFARGGYEGYTLRTDRFRYTEWLTKQYREGTLPYSEQIVHFRELYDYQNDPLETVNLIDDENYQTVRDTLHAYLSNFLIHQFDGTEDTLGTILRNPDFEEGVTPWQMRQCQIRLDTNDVQHGEHSLFIYARTRFFGGASQNITAGIANNGKGKYIVSGYYKFPSGTDTAKIQIRITNTDQQKKYFAALQPVNSNEWTEVRDTLNITWDGEIAEALVTLQTKSNMNLNYYVDNISIEKDSAVIFVDFGNEKPTKLFLTAYPNPFNPETTISYSLPAISLKNSEGKMGITLNVYNTLGQRIATLVNGEQIPGNYSVKFNAGDLPSGVYFLTLRTERAVVSHKILLLK